MEIKITKEFKKILSDITNKRLRDIYFGDVYDNWLDSFIEFNLNNEFLYDKKREKLKQCMEDCKYHMFLYDSFNWRLTKEGYEYWDFVFSVLKNEYYLNCT